MTTEPQAFTTDFAAEFPATEEAWRKAAEAALKGRPLASILSARTIDGVAFDAILPRREAKPVAGRPAGQRWTAMTRLDIADPEAANAQALEDLNNGASGLSLVLAGADGRGGLAADTLERLETALAGVLLDLAPVRLDAAPYRGRAAAAMFAALVERRDQDPADVAVLFGVDPLRSLAQSGALLAPMDKLAGGAADMIRELRGRGFASPVMMADQRLAHEAGASEAEELAGALAGVVQLVRSISDAGLDAETVLGAIALAFSADADQFATIAKFRAARLLFAALEREYGFGARAVHIHAETSRRMLAGADPQTNMVRNTIAAFAAGVGGADSVVTLPHTLALGGADADARRIARNTQAIVLEETNAYRVADPAAGAGAIEQATDALAEKAWEIFREIERDGGMLKALLSGAWQARVAATAAARMKAVAVRKIPIVGVSQFPKADETRPTLPEAAAPATAGAEPAPASAGFGALVEAFLAGASAPDPLAGGAAETAPVLAPRRLSAPFEELRAANEAKSPRPAVFMALVGPIARHGARAGFIRNLFEAGGLMVIDGPVEAEPSEAAEAYIASGASVAVVCGADPDYAENGAEAARALVAKGATVWLAGRPKDGQPELEAAGVSRFVAAGDDAIETLMAASNAKGGA